jgi:hypothetical protein
MGNKELRAEEAGIIYIDTEHVEYKAGSVITGTVCLDLFRPYCMKSFTIEVVGKEKVRWSELIGA